MKFNEFNLHPDLQRGIAEAGYIDCMPVQEQVLTHAFGGQDLYVQSQTGTGKTAAFLVVIFQRLLSEDLLAGKKALIMAPTRELAVQIEEEAKMLAKYLPFKIGSFYGGVGYTQQEKLLRENAQILVGTPGRVLDLNKSGRMNLMDIAFLVLDEADRMFDMGFYPDLRKLITVVPPADRRQTMLFSATLNAWVKNLAWEYTKSPFEIEIEPEIVTVQEIEQILYHVPSEDKMRLLLGVLAREQPESAVVFCNTKRYTEIVAKRLHLNGIDCEFIMGDLPQSRRQKVIDNVKAGKTRFLVATDVAARGLDIEGLAMVVNYDLPVEAENYVHRIGRTARAGKTGKAVTLASEQDVYELPAIERYIGKKIPSEIATPELLGDDKSAGMHIRTEFYEDRREERHLHGNAKAGEGRGARPHGQGRGGQGRGGERRGGAVRTGGVSRAGGTAHAEGRRDEQRRSEKGRDNRRQGGARTGASAQGGIASGGQDLSKMSFDERMALYKQKYVPGTPDATGGSAAKPGSGGKQRQNVQTAPTQKGGGRKGRDFPQGKKNAEVSSPAGAGSPKTGGGKNAGKANAGQKRPQQGGKQQAGSAGKPGGNAGRRVQRQDAAGSATARTDAPKQKQGIVSRLLGLFKKK